MAKKISKRKVSMTYGGSISKLPQVMENPLYRKGGGIEISE